MLGRGRGSDHELTSVQFKYSNLVVIMIYVATNALIYNLIAQVTSLYVITSHLIVRVLTGSVCYYDLSNATYSIA